MRVIDRLSDPLLGPVTVTEHRGIAQIPRIHFHHAWRGRAEAEAGLIKLGQSRPDMITVIEGPGGGWEPLQQRSGCVISAMLQ